MLELIFLPSASFSVVALLTTASGFLGVGAVAAVFMIPQACIAYAVPIMISSLSIALRTHDSATLPLVMTLLLMGVGISAFLRANWHNFLAIAELSRDKSALLARVSDELEQEHALLRAKEEAEAALTQANRTLQTLASRDPLTGIANRRIFDRALEGEMGRTTREGQPLSLLLIDVDHFKALNDEHGHQAGDECLRIIADTLKTIARRPGDIIARYGARSLRQCFRTHPCTPP